MTLALLLALTHPAQASEPRWTLSVDPLTAALGYSHLYLERALRPRLSVYGGPHMRLYDAPWSEVHEPYRGFGVELGVRFFPWAKAPEGPWVAARGVVAHAHTLEDPREGAIAGYGSGLVGYTWIPWDRLVLSGGLGLQYIHYAVADYGVIGVFPAAHTAIGVAF